jgi:PadR family transcriptional regulator PadR
MFRNMSELRLTGPRAAVVDAFLRDLTGEYWGYKLMRQTGLGSGTLYPILDDLEAKGWIEGRWVPHADAGRPPRRCYRLSASGATAMSRYASRAQRSPHLRPRLAPGQA